MARVFAGAVHERALSFATFESAALARRFTASSMK
jgi:hypothetical protein